METIHIPNENDFRRWLKEGLKEYFTFTPLSVNNNPQLGEEMLLTRKEIAGIFRISLVTLHDWMNRGLPFHKQRGRVYFLRSEVVEHVKQKKRPAF